MASSLVKCVAVGDNTVGKTSLLISFTRNTFSTTYIPISKDITSKAFSSLAEQKELTSPFTISAFESYAEYHTVDDKLVLLELWDVAAGEADDRIRPLAYPRTGVFIICFSLVDPNSYERVRTKWAPELAHYKPDVPVLVVGTKSDLREHSRTVDLLHERRLAPIQHHQGTAMCKDIGAKLYLECSALTSIGVNTVFENAMRLALQYAPRGRRNPNRRECVIL